MSSDKADQIIGPAELEVINRASTRLDEVRQAQGLNGQASTNSSDLLHRRRVLEGHVRNLIARDPTVPVTVHGRNLYLFIAEDVRKLHEEVLYRASHGGDTFADQIAALLHQIYDLIEIAEQAETEGKTFHAKFAELKAADDELCSKIEILHFVGPQMGTLEGVPRILENLHRCRGRVLVMQERFTHAYAVTEEVMPEINGARTQLRHFARYVYDAAIPYRS